MALNPIKGIGNLVGAAQKGLEQIDTDAIRKGASVAANTISSKANDIKDAAVSTKQDISDKLTELDRMLEQEITNYNDAYTIMNDNGVQLYMQRCRANDTINFVEELINSIANKPKSFESEFAEIKMNRKQFADTVEFADRELHAARESAAGAGAGLAAGASVAFMAPTAAMWVATTFGVASTGTAISTLSGAAATNAALAWLGGGALTAGGGGMAAGNALLALSGPVGWTIAGASLLGSIALFTTKKAKLNKQKNEEIEAVKKNTKKIKKMNSKIVDILKRTTKTRLGLNKVYSSSVQLFGKDYLSLNSDEKKLLGSLVNNTKALSVMLKETVE